MKEKILSLLGNHLLYKDAVVADYHDVAKVRLQDIDKHKNLMSSIVNNKDGMLNKVLSDNVYRAEFSELVRLDLLNLNAWVKEKINPHMKAYLEAFIQERENRGLFVPSQALKQAEHDMFQYLFNLPFDEDLEHILYVANMTLRFILQEWLLFPELVYDKESCNDFLDALDLSNCVL